MLEQLLRKTRVFPVVTLDRTRDAAPLAEVLHEAGIKLVEITLRSDVALDAISAIRRAGIAIETAAGTVRSRSDMDAAAAAGATLLISPGHSPELVEAARTSALPWLPGVYTPSDAMTMLAAGYRIQKLFPAYPPTGLALLDAWHGPFPDIALVPTGGIDATSLRLYLDRPNVLAVAGSWIAPRELIAAQNWAEISMRARRALALATGI